MERNEELRTAWEFVENTGRSIFLTGKAGTGKTTFLKAVVEKSRKRSIVVAPTGVAAINAGGVTIHSFFQLPLSPFVPDAQIKNKFDFGREKRKIISSIDLLIIDEISMVRADLLDAIDSVLRRYRDRYQPFGGVQLLMIGDLAQLTPVVTPEDERMLKPYYDTPYFFGSKALAQTEYVTIQLEKVYRQQDTSFIDILNHIRDGKPTAEDLQLLNSRVMPVSKTLESSIGSNAFIRLTTHNQLANNYNESELRKLPSQSFIFHAHIEGTFPEYSYPTSDTLELKAGAQVMFVKNDPSADHRYYNGKIGKVSYIDNNNILVKCEDDEEPIEVEPLEWENTRYTLNPDTREIETDVQGVFRQYPLRLAWAITIHKSQGLTFDHAIIDANQSFAPGQVYVALSRCRSLEGLALAQPLQAYSIISDEQVNGYINHQEQEAQKSISQLPQLKDEYERQLLIELFDFRQLLYQQEYMVRLFSEYFYNSNSSLTQLHKQALDDFKNEVINVADKWTSRIRIMQVEEIRQADFLERTKRSAEYFAQKLDAILTKPIKLSETVETNNKQARQRLNNALPELKQTWLSRRYRLTAIADRGFTVTNYLREKQMSMLDALDEEDIKKKKVKAEKVKKEKIKKAKEPKPQKEKTWETSFNLFNNGMSVEEIAHERSLTTSTIVGHLARYVKTGQIELNKLISPEKQQTILRVIGMVGTAQGSSAIKALCPEDITYDEIRLMMSVN